MKNNKVIGKYCLYFILVLGAVFAFIGIFLLLHFAPIYDYIIKNALTIAPGTKAYEAWRTNDPPLILDFYFFNWTNPKDVYNAEVRPHFQEVGPYRFREVKEKYDIRFHDNDTVSYQFVKKYFFMGEESPRPLSDVINTINTIALVAAHKGRYWDVWKRKALSFGLSTTSKVFVTKSIEELLFAGYEDSFLNIARNFQPFLSKDKILDKFGWFYQRNNTYGISGNFSMYTKNDERFGQITSWNDRNQTDFYEGKCGALHGSAGEFYPMNRNRDSIEFYSSEMCAFGSLDYEKDVEVKGVKAYKYSSDTLFDNGSRISENECFCNGECLPSGVFNISSCRSNAPIFLSLPHFYNADPYFTRAVDGLAPDKEKHDFYISLEPKSAIVIEIGARIQLNILLQPVKGISLYEGVPKVLFPVFYFDQIVTMSDDLAFNINLLQNLPEINKGASVILISIGVILLIYIVINCMCSLKSKKQSNNEQNVSQIPRVVEEIPLRKELDI